MSNTATTFDYLGGHSTVNIVVKLKQFLNDTNLKKNETKYVIGRLEEEEIEIKNFEHDGAREILASQLYIKAGSIKPFVKILLSNLINPMNISK